MRSIYFNIACLAGLYVTGCCAGWAQPAGGDETTQGKTDKAEEVIVVCKTHFDIGYTHRVKDIISYYRGDMIKRALDIVDQSGKLPVEQQFTWVSPGWVMQKVVEQGEDQSPELRGRLDAAIRKGRFITHALPFTLEADFLDPEPMARGYMFSDRVAKMYGFPLSRSAKTTDVPSEPGTLATVLAKGGVKFIHIGCNWPSGYVHDLPPLFWWEGPDGSRVMCMYSPIYSSTTAFNPWGMSEGKPGKVAPNIGVNFMPPAHWPYKTWLAIIVTGDNQGPPQGDDIQKLFAEVQEKRPDLKVRMGTMDEFAEAILKENPSLPVIKKEMPDTWVHGLLCDPRGMTMMSETGMMLPAYEMLNTQMKLAWGKHDLPDAEEKITKAFEQYLLYGEHTWGGSARVEEYGEKFHQQPRDKWADLEASWEDKSHYIQEASRLMTEMKDDALRLVAGETSVSGDRLVVFNPLPWDRSGYVDVDGVPYYVTDIPASGFKAMHMPDLSAKTAGEKELLIVEDDTLENEYYRVVFDQATGALISFYDKRLKREWVKPSGEFHPGCYMNERFDKQQTEKYCLDYQQGRWGSTLHVGMSKPGIPDGVPYRKALARQGVLKSSQSGECGEITVEYPADVKNFMPASELQVRLGKHTPYVDFRITIKDKPRDNWPEADWAVFPFDMENPGFTVSRALGYMDPATDIAKGANKALYGTGNGVLMRDAGGDGIAVLPLDHPIISLDEPGMWKFSLDFVPRKPIVYVNLYNNMWNTNFRYWYEGDWSSRIRVWSVSPSDGNDKGLIIPALEARMPMQAVRGTGSGGKMAGREQGVKVSRKGVIVTAFGRNSLTDQLVLRLWNMTGQGESVTVELPGKMNISRACPINLRGEREGDPIPVHNGKFGMQVKGFSPAGFALE